MKRPVMQHSKRIVPGLAAVALVSLLGACGLIPAQPISDPLGVDGQEVAVVFTGGATLAAQTVTGVAAAGFQFSNGDTSRIPINPARVSAPIGFEPDARLNDPAGPQQITLSDPLFTVRVWEGASDYDDADADARVEVEADFTGTFTLERGDCDAQGCDYTFIDEAAGIESVDLTGGTLSTFLAISTDGPVTNFGEVVLEVGGDPDSLAGSTLTLTIDGGEGEVSF